MEYFNEKIQSYLEDINDTSKKFNNVLGIYCGTFDPFHEGHKEIIRVVLNNYCCKLLCMAMRTNENKPNMLNYKHRYRLLNLALSSETGVFIIENPIKEIEPDKIIDAIRKQFKNIKIFGILGSDIYTKFLIKNKFSSKVDGYLIVPRDDFIMDNICVNSKFILINKELFKYNKACALSSTKIREKVIKNLVISEDDLCLESKIYIENNFLYIDFLNIVYEKLLNYSTFKNIKKTDLINLSRPFSGNYVYEICKNSDNKLLNNQVVKIYTCSDISEGKSQIQMLEWMKNYNIPTVNIIDHYQYDKLYFMIMDKVEGTTFRNFLINGAYDEDKIFRLSEIIGKQLKRIHDYQYIIPSKEHIDYWLNRINLSVPLSSNDFINEPGLFCLKLHGDFNLSNIIINNNDVIIIDPEPGEYPGPPAYDYCRFLGGINILDIKHKNIIEKGFRLGYGLENLNNVDKLLLQS